MKEKVIISDLHTHLLEYKTKPEKYWKAVKAVGLQAVAITEHIEHNPKKAFEKLFEKKPEDVMLIPGMELFTSAGHVLAYHYSPEIYEIPELQVKGIKMQKVVEIAQEEDIVLSFAHPWGFDYDSVVYVAGMTELRKYAVHGSVGVEAYNGIIGELAESVIKSKWVKKPLGFFGFLEKNKLSNKTGIGKLMGEIKKRLDKRAWDLVQRNINAMEFGESAKFITAGSDAHSTDRIGCGILKLKVHSEYCNETKFLKELKNKENVLWAGPPLIEIGDGVFKRKKSGVKKTEVLAGLKYVTKAFARKKKNK